MWSEPQAVTMELVLAITLGTARICPGCKGLGGWRQDLRIEFGTTVGPGTPSAVQATETRYVCMQCGGCGIVTP